MTSIILLRKKIEIFYRINIGIMMFWVRYEVFHLIAYNILKYSIKNGFGHFFGHFIYNK
jgi:hypothetical protein